MASVPTPAPLPTLADYLELIPSQFQSAPKFMAWCSFWGQQLIAVRDAMAGITPNFDLDAAYGAQLDAIGLWIGAPRGIETPIPNIYFTVGDPNLGVGQGVIKGPFDTDDGVTSLDDQTYRLLLKAKLGLNVWDGTAPQLAQILSNIFGLGTVSQQLWGDSPNTWGTGNWGDASNTGTLLMVQDNDNGSIDVNVSGDRPSQLFLAILANGALPFRMAGIKVNGYHVIPVANAPGPLFGIGMQNAYVAGVGTGAIGQNITPLS